MDFAELFACYMGVNLRGGNVFVAQKFLKSANIHALREEVGGKAVAHYMRGSIKGNSCLYSSTLKHCLDGAWRYPAGIGFFLLACVGDKKSVVIVGADFEVSAKPV